MKTRPIVCFCSDSTHVFVLTAPTHLTIFIRDCLSFYFQSYWSTLFLSAKGYCVYMINKIIYGCLSIWNFSSRVQLDISLVCCAYSWVIELNVRREIPYLRAPIYYSLFDCRHCITVSKSRTDFHLFANSHYFRENAPRCTWATGRM